MAVYYVLGILLVVWALGLAALGLTRPDFPPSGSAGRALIGASALIVAGALVALLVTTKKEHPREEASAKAAEQKQAAPKAPAAPTAPTAPRPKPPPASSQGGKTVKASEKEFSISLASGTNLKAGKYVFADQNVGKIQHDLAIQGNGKEVKTPLLNPGQSKSLPASLTAGKYKFYCTVPGHEQAGMKVEVTVK